MSAVRVIWVGRRAPGALTEAAGEFANRVRRFTAYSEVRVRPEEGRSGDPVRALALERERITSHLVEHDVIVALDEGGVQWTTQELARWIEEWRERGRLVFIVGSDLGLDDGVKRQSRLTLGLSRLTLPHQLARVLLLEQLYRAFDLLAGGGYHRA